MTSIIFSTILFLIISTCYVIWKIKKISFNDILKDFVDVSPAFLAFYFSNDRSIAFLMVCLIANEFIYDNLYLGAGFFTIGYIAASILSVSFPINYMKVAISLVSSVSIIFPLLCLYKGNWKFSIGAGIYGSITLPFLFYAFYTTWNPGFLALIIGDVLLLVGEMFPNNKVIRLVSDLFYFFGTCFVPLSLSGGWII